MALAMGETATTGTPVTGDREQKEALAHSELVRRRGALTLCRASELLARDSSAKGVERALAETKTDVEEINRVVERFIKCTVALRAKGSEPCHSRGRGSRGKGT